MQKLAIVLCFVFGLPGIALATAPLVQNSTVANANAVDPAASLGSNTTAGNILIVAETTSIGNFGDTISGQGATWTKIADSNSSTSTGNRVFIWCGVVVTPGKTVTLTATGGGNREEQLAEFSLHACPLAGSTQTASVGNTGTTGVLNTSTIPVTQQTLNAFTLTLFLASHRHAETVTDSSGMTLLANDGATTASFLLDWAYGSATTYNPSASWTSSSAAANVAVAISDPCTNHDACVQQTVGATSAGGGAGLTLTFPNTVAANNVILTYIFFTGANNTSTISVPFTNPTDIRFAQPGTVLDSGQATSSGRRVYVLCGVVGTPGTTEFLQPGAFTISAAAIEVTGYTCSTDHAASTANSSGSSVTSITATGYTSTTSNDFFVALAGHSTQETQTDTSTGGFRPLPQIKAAPSLSMDYFVASGTATGTPNYSWSTAGPTATGVVALKPGSNSGPITIAAAYPIALPNPNVPPPPISPNIGVVWKGTEGLNLPSNPTANVSLYYQTFSWAALEPTDCTGLPASDPCWNWGIITAQENRIPNGTKMQILINTGEAGTPNSLAACNAANILYGVTTCIPWLGPTNGYAGVATHYRAGCGTGPPCAARGGLQPCDLTYDNAPWDSNYQTKFRGFLTAFEAKFGGDPLIAMVSFHPMSELGHNLTMSVGITNQICPNGTTLSEAYNQEWNTAAVAAGCTSGDNACFENKVVAGFDALYTSETTTWGDQNLGTWIQNQAFPSITNCNLGGTACDYAVDSATSPTGIYQRVWNFVDNNPQTNGGKTYVEYEALANNNAWSNIVSPWLQNGVHGGAQMVKGFYTAAPSPTQCANSNPQIQGCCNVCYAAIHSALNIPPNPGTNPDFEQIYAAKDIPNCPGTMNQIASFLNGNTSLTCPAPTP